MITIYTRMVAADSLVCTEIVAVEDYNSIYTEIVAIDDSPIYTETATVDNYDPNYTEKVATNDDDPIGTAFLFKGLEGFGFSMLMDIYNLMLSPEDRRKGLCTVLC